MRSPFTPKNRLQCLGILFSLFLFSCAGVNPHHVKVQLKPEPPAPKVTSFDRALSQLGLMTLIYGCDILTIMPFGGKDSTGASYHTGGEIPADFMWVIESSLNAIGGNVYYVPFNPDLIDTLVRLGWTTYADKMVPTVILKGGITEFDRALSTRGKNNELDVETKPFTNAPKWWPGDTIGVDYEDALKKSAANITVDFNLVDPQRNIGIHKMQAVNSIIVQKAAAEKELAVTLFGPTFGLKGSIKKVEGRHAAVRLLVQLSMIQVVGKFFDLPYWNLIPGTKPDPVVVEILQQDFAALNGMGKMLKIQEYLYLIGYDIPITGTLDETTLQAMKAFDPGSNPEQDGISLGAIIKLYASIPVTQASLQRRYQFNGLLNEFVAGLNAPKATARTKPAPEPKEVSKSEETRLTEDVLNLLGNPATAKIPEVKPAAPPAENTASEW